MEKSRLRLCRSYKRWYAELNCSEQPLIGKWAILDALKCDRKGIRIICSNCCLFSSRMRSSIHQTVYRVRGVRTDSFIGFDDYRIRELAWIKRIFLIYSTDFIVQIYQGTDVWNWTWFIDRQMDH